MVVNTPGPFRFVRRKSFFVQLQSLGYPLISERSLLPGLPLVRGEIERLPICDGVLQTLQCREQADYYRGDHFLIFARM